MRNHTILYNLIHKKIKNIDNECAELLVQYMKQGVPDIRYKHQRLQMDKELYEDLIDEYHKEIMNQ